MRKFKKNFVTGVFGSGKTNLAKKISRREKLPFVDFDNLHNYSCKKNQAIAILKQLPRKFVIDAIPIDNKASWSDFSKYERNNNVQIICVYCPNENEWIKRMYYRDKINYQIKNLHNIVFQLLLIYQKIKKVKVAIKNQEKRLKEYRNFFIKNIPVLETFENVKYYDSVANEFTSKSEMLKRIKFDKFPLKNHLYKQSYDKYYQDIAVINFIGYSKSYKTWNRIKNLVKWRGKKVIDLGCFHGYFSFKIEDSGGIVQGFDASKEVLKTARLINKFRRGHVVFKHWIGGNKIPKCNVVLCLNVLHHFENPDKTISKMQSETAIFEINESDKPTVEKYFRNIKKYDSHRKNRVILLCHP